LLSLKEVMVKKNKGMTDNSLKEIASNLVKLCNPGMINVDEVIVKTMRNKK